MNRRDSMKLMITAASGVVLPAVLPAQPEFLDSMHPSPGSAPASASDAPARTTISLDGVWEIAEGKMEAEPETYDHHVPVPGLVDMATPAFIDPGPVCADIHQWQQKDPRRDAFWYRRSFEVKDPIPAVARLKVAKAMFGTRVFLNGKLLGDHFPSFTPGYFAAASVLKRGKNTLVIRIGADRDAVIGRAESGWDSEKSRYIPGIFDSVELFLSGTPHILNVQVVPDIDNKSAGVRVWLRHTGAPAAEKLRITIREATSGKTAGEADIDVAAPTDGDVQETIVHVPICECRHWSPEDPFLYTLEVYGSADSFSTRFGMRTFSFDHTEGHAILNGKPYYMRGSNVTLYRFFEDALRGDKPWREEWVRRLHQSFRYMHWNSLRYSLMLAPESWYRIADEEGILIQDEFPIWTGFEKDRHDPDELAVEYREWMEERWNHPSVVIWDGANESYDPVMMVSVNQVRGIDHSNRPWDAGWDMLDNPGDPYVIHTYQFIGGPEQPFHMYKMDNARNPDSKAGLLADQYLGDIKVKQNNALVINEYGGLWLNRDGSPTVFSKQGYDYLLGPAATAEDRRKFYARTLAATTEFFRAHRLVAAVMQFTALGYSRPGGVTSDDFIDVEKLTRDSNFTTYLRDAFAPVGIMVNSWAQEYPAGATHEFPVLLVNDRNEDWKGNVRFRLLLDGKVLEVNTMPTTIVALGTGRLTFTISIPSQPAKYQVDATLLETSAGPVRSVRDFSVWTSEQREMHRNLAKDCEVLWSSPNSPSHVQLAQPSGDASKPTPAPPGPQFLSIDLGQEQSLSCIVLAWGWARAPKVYSIETSTDNAQWNTVHRGTNNQYEMIDTARIPQVSARWIRANIPQGDSKFEYVLQGVEMYH